ncbi:flagellar export chaperone FlgN [Aeromonas simiae]|nr:flagellar export chaperone FlgN [Aeromonas simiae]MDO2948354.1 flagellar protein FlgN [Aeromonas simiae]MDO2955737.1 flagellar protein FlgN [Aeromonas simiae]
MNKRRQYLQSLVQGVQQDVGRYQQLSVQLDEQYLLLGQHDVEGLNRFNLNHTELMKEIQQQAQTRSQQLNALGFDPNERGMARLIEQLPDPIQARFSPLWLRLENLLLQCKQKNERNGQLLASQVETIRRLLGQTPSYGESSLGI